MKKLACKAVFYYNKTCFTKQYTRAGVSEWQTRQTQNLLPARACGFESHRRHEKREPCIIQDSHFLCICASPCKMMYNRKT